MLRVVCLFLLLGSVSTFTTSRILLDQPEESSGMNRDDGGTVDRVFNKGSKGNTIEEDNDFSISTLLEKANKNLGKSPTDPVVRELDIVVNDGLQNADPCTATGCMWPKANDGKVYVPYTISNQYSQNERTIIIQGLDSFAQSTCIHFIVHSGQRDFVDIQSDNGCYSNVGRQGGAQVVSLQSQGCLYRHTIQHEMMHVLGFEHEHSRSDRDLHVKIQMWNVIRAEWKNFNIIKTNNLRTPYDYNSVMQYGSLYFSKNGKPTIVPIPNRNATIGQARAMSPNDILRINRLYSC